MSYEDCECEACVLERAHMKTRNEEIARRYRTQKARDYVSNDLGSRSLGSVAQTRTEAESKAIILISRHGRVFARPCPTTPRHGFVDSRVLTSGEEVSKLWDEMAEVDPDGEMILARYIDACESLVMHKGGAAVGEGHDGATAGRPGSLFFPLALREDYKLDAPHQDEFVYLEYVTMAAGVGFGMPREGGSELRKGRSALLVQLRAGPEQALYGSTVIPSSFKCSGYVKATPDTNLLEWERDLAALPEQEEGCSFAVWMPLATPTAHAAIHAINNKLPLFFTEEPPVVGQSYEETGVPEVQWSDELYRLGAARALNYPLHTASSRSLAFKIACMVVHQSSSILTSPRGSECFGLAAGLAVRLGFMAVACEGRHAIRYIPGWNPARHDAYAAMADWDIDKLREAAGWSWWTFDALDWSGSYGGDRWSECMQSTVALENSLKESRGGPTKIVNAFNVFMNQVHNGGWWLNKFSKKTIADELSRGGCDKSAPACAGLWRALQLEADPHQADHWFSLGEVEWVKPVPDMHQSEGQGKRLVLYLRKREDVWSIYFRTARPSRKVIPLTEDDFNLLRGYPSFLKLPGELATVVLPLEWVFDHDHFIAKLKNTKHL